MYNNSYEEYMRNSLGYNIGPVMNMDSNNKIYEEENNFTYNQVNVENMYPEIYKIVYPMVCKACMNVQENITEDLVSRITNDIYLNIESNEMNQQTRSTSSNINVQNNKNITNRTNSSTLSNNTTTFTSNVRQEDRNRSPLLRDLIRILVLRELLGNPIRPRPPYGGIGPGPGSRPPYMF